MTRHLRLAAVAAVLSASVPASAGMPAMLGEVTFDDQRVTANVSHRVEIRTELIPSYPPKLAIDFLGTELGTPRFRREGSGALVMQVWNGQYQPFVSRVAVQLKKKVEPRIAWNGNQVTITLDGGAPLVAAAPAPKPSYVASAAQTAAAPAKAAAIETPVAAPEPMLAAAPAEPQPEARPKQRTLTSIEGGADRATLRFTETGEFTVAYAENPSRILIDLPGTLSSPMAAQGMGALGKVTAVQQGSGPTAKTQAVLELKEAVSYRVTKTPVALDVELLR